MIHVKAPVFSFNKLADVDSLLGPEMKSTGEVMGSDHSFEKALYKAFVGANMKLPANGSVLFTVKDKDKQQALTLAKRFAKIGYRIFATAGTAEFLNENGLHTMTVAKIGQAKPGILDVLQNNEVDIVINTMDHDQEKVSDGFVIRQTAIEHNIALLTSFDTVDALLKALENRSFSTTAL